MEGAIIKVKPKTLTDSNISQTNNIGMVVYFLMDSIDEVSLGHRRFACCA